MKRFILIAAAAVALSVCASASDYKAAENPGAPGYFTAPADNGRWAVIYTGSTGQSKDEVAEYALKRAGDFSAEQGKEWFAVINSETRRVAANVAGDLTDQAGHFLGSNAQQVASSPGASGSNSPGNTPSFGGAQVPNNVLEHWAPRKIYQTILTVQLGAGDRATFPGLSQTPQIFPATRK